MFFDYLKEIFFLKEKTSYFLISIGIEFSIFYFFSRIGLAAMFQNMCTLFNRLMNCYLQISRKDNTLVVVISEYHPKQSCDRTMWNRIKKIYVHL